jgi:hypothetical protein
MASSVGTIFRNRCRLRSCPNSRLVTALMHWPTSLAVSGRPPLLIQCGTGDGNRCAAYQLRAVVTKIAIHSIRQLGGERCFKRTTVFGFVGPERSPPSITPTLKAGVDHGLCHIAGTRRPSAQHRDHQPVAEQQGATPLPQRICGLRALHEFVGEIVGTVGSANGFRDDEVSAMKRLMMTGDDR